MEKVTPFHYFDGKFSMSDIKIVYLPQNGQVAPNVVTYDATVSEPTAEVKDYIAEKWLEANKKEFMESGNLLKNENLLSVGSIDLESGELSVTPTQYKRWKSTAKKDFHEKFPDAEIPVPLNVQMLVETADKQLVLGPRPGKDSLQVPGGMVNTTDLRVTRINSPLTTAAIREFNEEVAPVPVLNPSFLGTSFYAGRVLTTVFMTGQIEMSADDLNEYRHKNAGRIKDFKEFPQLECIGATKPELETAIHTQKFQETALIALLLFGHQKFGPQFLKKHCPPQMLAAHLQQKTR